MTPQDYTVVLTRPAMAEELATLQRLCFPTLSPDHLITAEHYKHHIDVFPEGQMAVLAPDGTIAAASGDLRVNLDLDNIEHRYIDMVDHNWLGTHDPAGAWLYGFDISVHPAHRGKGLSKLLYAARQNLARHLGLKGHVIGGMMRGYPAHKEKMTPLQYMQAVAKGDIFDPVLSVQMKNGYNLHGVINNYLDDPSCDNKAGFLIWRPEGGVS